MDDTVWSDATRQELRINTNIRTCVHDDSARKQNLSQQPPLRVVSTGFVGAIQRAVDWKGVFIKLIPSSAQNGSDRHQKP
jgi:hypothetical protein